LVKPTVCKQNANVEGYESLKVKATTLFVTEDPFRPGASLGSASLVR
jgi:hypothetical protein